MLEGDIVQMGAYIGAGLACTGMGGAAYYVYRHRVRGSFGDFLFPRCAPSNVRCLTNPFLRSWDPSWILGSFQALEKLRWQHRHKT